MSSPIVLKMFRIPFGYSFTVEGTSGEYTVDWTIHQGWYCECPHHQFRKAFCKHIEACKDYAAELGLVLSSKLYFDEPAHMEMV